MRTLDEFTQAIATQDTCPPDLSRPLQALWYDQRGQWNRAHDIVQDAGDPDSAWVHAYLHREEGDLSNARYWYRRSGQPEFRGSLAEEWAKIAEQLLARR